MPFRLRRLGMRRVARRFAKRPYAVQRPVRGLDGPRSATVSRSFDPKAVRPITHATSLQQQIQCQFYSAAKVLLTTSTLVPTFASQIFSVADVSSANMLTAFDQYRIDMIEIWLEPSAATTTQFTDYGSAIDLDDSNLPTVVGDVIHRQNALVTGGGCGHYHRFVPHAANALYAGAFNGFGNVKAQWVDSASPNVQHYGLKVYCALTFAAVSYYITTRYTVSFRGPGVA